MDERQKKSIIDYLKGKLSTAHLMLFTGAGFSVGAKDKKGQALPTSKDLSKEIWKNFYPDDSFEESYSLADVFELARQKGEKQLCNYLKQRLTVDSQSLTEEYKILIHQPWKVIYTLNIDDLFRATQARFNFDRKIVCISESTPPQKEVNDQKDLIVNHLNGMLEDLPDNVIFSREQSAINTLHSNASYMSLTAKLLQYPTIFIGSQLDEESLWHYIHLRKEKGRGSTEFRPRSFIVIPKLSKLKEMRLKDYNIEWIPQTFQEFSKEFLLPLKNETEAGIQKIQSTSSTSTVNDIPLVSDLMIQKTSQIRSPYLLGAEPTWKDMTEGIAIERDKEKEWTRKILNYKKKESTPIFIITGTAGDGKTSLAMKIALSLLDHSYIVGWIDRNSDIPPHQIIPFLEKNESMNALFIDTPDMYGIGFPQILSRLANQNILKTIVLMIRSNKVDNIIESPLFQNKKDVQEFATYRLLDNEIDKILKILDQKNLLGYLKGKSLDEQRSIFKGNYQRQLLVAMIESTSGKKFKDKIYEESEQLDEASRAIYYLTSVATNYNCGLLKEEIMLGIDQASNSHSNHIDKLIRRNLFIENKGRIQLRHKVIAEEICQRLSSENHLIKFYARLARIAAIKSIEKTSETKRMQRLLKHIINHERLLKITYKPHNEVYKLYEDIEDLQKDHHHFWLQRGCFMLAVNRIDLAENYLNQSYGLNPKDPLVRTSLANLKFQQVLSAPHNEKSHFLAGEAYEEIINLIDERGYKDIRPYHILGKQGLKWAKKGIKDIQKRKEYIARLWEFMKKALKAHPRSKEIKELHNKLKDETLNFAIRNS